ncbi:unnamed protein product [Lathyrus sativus]|nr:unnamed protein product [Lathyrus sativus]
MEVITEGGNSINISDSINKNRIHVSNSKKPIFFFVNLAKRYMQQYNEVELSALGSAIASVVSVAEILKQSGLAVEKKIKTSTVILKDNSRARPLQKARIEILLEKTANFDELMAAAAAVAAEKAEKAAAEKGEKADKEKGEKAAAAENGENADKEKGEKAAAAENSENADKENGEKAAAENDEKEDKEEHTA